MSTPTLTPEEMLNGPAFPPPDGVDPNFENPPNMNEYAFATFVICLFFGTTTTFIRLYSKFFVVKSAHLGDYLLIAAYGLFVALITFMFRTLLDVGIFVHMWNIRGRDIGVFLNYALIMTNLFSAFVPTIKIAICVEWLHLFSTRSNRGFVFWSCHLVIWVNVILYTTLLIFINVVPVDVFWSTNGHTDVASSSINVVTDLLMLAIPQRTIWRLQMTTRKKIGVSLVFTIGVFASIAATVRLGYSISQATHPPAELDATYHFSAVIVSALTEAVCGLLILCVPTFPKAFNFVTRVAGWSTALNSRMRWTSKNDYKASSTSRSSEARGPRTRYEEIDENALPLTSTTSRSQLAASNNQIIRTTDFKASYSTGPVASTNFSRHHNWDHEGPKSERDVADV